MGQIRANSVLPAKREVVELETVDGLVLVGELALPADVAPAATIIFVHPLPTAGGMMDSHLIRKASWRLPALAEIAVLRFNTRGTASSAGTSEGEFDAGEGEGLDLAAALEFVRTRGLPPPWLVGWSFGTDVILKAPDIAAIAGIILVSPTLRYTSTEELARWAQTDVPMVALIPEFDDFLRPEAAAVAFGSLPHVKRITGWDAKHLWVGEPSVQFVLNEIVRVVQPSVLMPENNGLPTEWDGPIERWTDL
jgi:alpha/beta superfamily hydrolase